MCGDEEGWESCGLHSFTFLLLITKRKWEERLGGRRNSYVLYVCFSFYSMQVKRSLESCVYCLRQREASLDNTKVRHLLCWSCPTVA